VLIFAKLLEIVREEIQPRESGAVPHSFIIRRESASGFDHRHETSKILAEELPLVLTAKLATTR
jgi:hypothetical protein